VLRITAKFDKINYMTPTIRHDRQQETIEAKTLWFRSLSIAERMEILCGFTDLALSANPRLKDRKHAQPATGRIQVLSMPQNVGQTNNNDDTDEILWISH
jgi:hypothetical protein